MEQAKHYSLPWELKGEPGKRWIASANGFIVLSASASAECPRAGDYYACGGPEACVRMNLREENAARIVQSVNAHDELVAALEGLMALESRDRFMPTGREWDAARAAIAKAAALSA